MSFQYMQLPPRLNNATRTNKHKDQGPNHKANMAAAKAAVYHSIHEHFALLGNAINPDTGASAEYPELINCSDAPLWIALRFRHRE
jgi:hypothetical protein